MCLAGSETWWPTCGDWREVSRGYGKLPTDSQQVNRDVSPTTTRTESANNLNDFGSGFFPEPPNKSLTDQHPVLFCFFLLLLAKKNTKKQKTQPSQPRFLPIEL